ncbi:MAG: hypothetical protein GVY34_09385 [Alphaproteobacteria bacterium]|nr:hypothetical protein [Alphaproteobacteria bacterium]
MKRTRMYLTGAAMTGAAIAAAVVVMPHAPTPLTQTERLAHYDTPLPAPDGDMGVYYLGHSLIGPDIPAFVQQLAQAARDPQAFYNSQLGWGASLRTHWEPDEVIPGYDVMNQPPAHRPAKAALRSGDYDALVLTEMIDLKDAIRWHDSGRYTALWAQLARKHAPEIRVYKYETWHQYADAADWIDRIERDAEALWEGTILAQAKAYPGVGTIHVIPAGRAMAAFAREIGARGGLPGMASADTLFTLTEDGLRDDIHPSDKAAYLVALVHYATLYHADPRGLPHALLRADGTPAEAPAPEVAALMQQVAWDVVRSVRSTGIVQISGGS